MAQACVMAPPRPQDQLLTPGKQPLSPQLDNSLITSTVRKRKGARRHGHLALRKLGRDVAIPPFRAPAPERLSIAVPRLIPASLPRAL
jgi:hypothetical protein